MKKEKSQLSEAEKKVLEKLGMATGEVSKAVQGSEALKKASQAVSSAIESDAGVKVRGTLQKYDNVKLGIYSAAGEAARGNIKASLKKLGDAVKSITDSPSESLKNSIDGEDVLKSFGVDDERAQLYGPVVEMVGPEAALSAPFKAAQITAKALGAGKIVGKINKASSLVNKVTEGIDKATSVTGNLKTIGKGAKVIGERAPEIKKLTDTVSTVTKNAVSVAPKQIGEGVRRSQIRGLVKKSFPMSKDADYEKVKKQIDKASDYLISSRIDGEKVYFNKSDDINEIAQQTKQRAIRKSKLILKNTDEEAGFTSSISGPKVYQRALDKTLAKKLPPYGKGKVQIETELRNAIGPTYEVPRPLKKIDTPDRPIYEVYEPELPPVIDPSAPTIKRKIGKLSNAEKKNIEILKSRGVPEDIAYALKKEGIAGYDARQLVRDGADPQTAMKAAGIDNPSAELQDALKYEYDLNKVETENYLDSQLNKIKKSEVDARNAQKKKTYEDALREAQKEMEDQLELIKQKPMVEVPYEPPIMQAYENKSALGAQLSRAQADKTPVSAIEASRKAYSEEIAAEVERVLGPEAAQRYRESESNYGLGAQLEQVAKKSFANDYELDVGQVYPSKSGVMAEAIESARGYIPKGIEALDKPVRNTIQEIIINSGDDKELAREKMKEYLRSNPSEAAKIKDVIRQKRASRSPKSIGPVEEVNPQKIEAVDMSKMDFPKANPVDIMAPDTSLMNEYDENVMKMRENEIKKKEFELQENMKKMRLPRNTDYLYNNKDAVKAKVSTIAPDIAGAIDYMSPEEFKNAIPDFAKASPNSFEYDEYNTIDGKVYDVKKFIDNIRKDQKFNSIEKAILINKAYKGEPIA